MNNLKQIWQDSEGLIVPKIFYAKDNNDKIFYIFNDKSTILYMISKDKRTTFCIPKKYCTVKKNYYLIDNYDKMVAISCSAKNEYENFVIQNIINLQE